MKKTIQKISLLFTIVLLLLMGLIPLKNTYSANPAKTQVKSGQTAEFYSQLYKIDKKYKSMAGPQSSQEIHLLEGGDPKLLWVTGYDAVMMGENKDIPLSQEFMCHSNLDFNSQEHQKNFREQRHSVSTRLFTLSQGQFSIRFPEGFGIPILSGIPLNLTTQVLNLNIENKNLKVRHKVTVHFIRDDDLDAPFTALYPSSAYGLKLLEGKDGYYYIDEADEAIHGSGCLTGTNASGHTYSDSYGRKFTGHWIVKPGREENRTLVTKIMRLPYDTSIHYIAVHLHPFAESLELIDLTSGKVLFKSTAYNSSNKIGLDAVEHYSSREGIPVYKDHQYEIVSTYNNTTNEDQDAMAVMYLYLLDKNFVKPTIEMN